MRPIHAVLPTALAALALAASVTPAAGEEPAPLYVRQAMQAEINPAIVAIWDIGNAASDENGMLDGTQMTEESWQALANAASDLAAAAERMASASDIRAASPGNMATEDYEVSMAQVQAYIDEDPQGFRDLAASFAQLARTLENAARARDVATAGNLVATMDTECSVCHSRYWYAEAQ